MLYCHHISQYITTLPSHILSTNYQPIVSQIDGKQEKSATSESDGRKNSPAAVNKAPPNLSLPVAKPPANNAAAKKPSTLTPDTAGRPRPNNAGKLEKKVGKN